MDTDTSPARRRAPRRTLRRASRSPLARVLTAAAAAGALVLLAGCAPSADSAGDGSSDQVVSAGGTAADAGELVEVQALSPASGPLVGGATVTVTGSGFEAAEGVVFGSQPAAFEVVSDTELVATTPASADFVVGGVPVTVTLADGSTTTTGAEAYSYETKTGVDAEMAYAFAHWQDYNLDEWGVFSDNDCGNFVNQAMVARGWTQSDDWYSDYATTGDYSLSWIRGNEMDDYYASRPDTTYLSDDQRSLVKIGDVAMFDWDPQTDNGVDHTMIVSKVETKPDGSISITLVGHTVDAQYRDLDNAITVENPGGSVHFWSIA